ncbi:hypothetical protein VFPPC_12471 [Pochonia chlamydosporia 170]|uniref:Integral membrane protein n=1 Tax=Pochonia chlamydosporia 170 TaxID=1380566 RepID=A0A179EW52_METCM|nr:hypothetical protein VFPPC_12471 [Pochonia chlamydosporia 170]OAQ57402.1 hypothetical protein VFPPC_12471 [Pochonia chlamydosporia 170]
MSPTSTTDIPPYFELSWAVISTIGLNNVLVGFMVAGIIGRMSPILLVPIVVSAACALANGLCYIAYIAKYPVVSTAVAAAFAGVAWLVQEAGLPFYSYMILASALHSAERMVFQALFWTLMLLSVALRCAGLVVEVRFIAEQNISADLYKTVTRRLTVAGFVTMALVECTSAVFLLKIFRSVLRSLPSPESSGTLYHYLMRSTEIRVASLALIGVMRAVTFSWYAVGTGGDGGLAGQLDRIDILASRLLSANDSLARCNLGSEISAHPTMTTASSNLSTE